jgi:hypothetical protein
MPKLPAPNSTEPFPVCTMRITNIGKWKLDLEYIFGVIPNKTYRVGPPRLYNMAYQLAFIKGLIDGDGWISMRNNINFGIGIGSCSKIVYWLQEVVEKNLFYSLRLRKILHKKTMCNKDYYVYTIAGRPASLLFCLLNSLPTPCLTRKWQNPQVLEIVAKHKSENPRLFEQMQDHINKLFISDSSTI